MSKNFILWLSVLIFVITGGLPNSSTYGQGMATNPPRLYFTAPPGGNETQKLTIMNTGQMPLELGISIGDWDYDSLGNNRLYDAGSLTTSAADWIRIFPSSYLVLQPGERKDLEVTLTPPADTGRIVPVHTAMIFLTQLNPVSSQIVQGANIKINIRSGTKVYHSFFPGNTRDIEITDFKKTAPVHADSAALLELALTVDGKLWVEGHVRMELLNMQSGEKTRLPDIRFYALPGDIRIVRTELPVHLPAGRYTVTAQISFGKRDELKVAELEFAIDEDRKAETGDRRRETGTSE